MTSRKNKAKKNVQTPRVAANSGKGRLKVCPPQARKLLQWANLAGDEALPSRLPLPAMPVRTAAEQAKGPPKGNTLSDLVGALDRLPSQIKMHLHELMNRPEEWAETPAEARKEFRARFSTPEEANAATKGWDFRFACQFSAVYRRYKLILAARETLRAIVNDKASEWPTTAFMKRGDDGKGKYAGDPIADALLDAEIDYIKRCPRCRVFFYAGRNNIDYFPPSCADAAREAKRKEKKKSKKEEVSK